MRRLICLAIAVLVVLPLLASADNKASKQPASKQPDKASRGGAGTAKSSSGITPQQEAAAVALVQKHHSDLFELLIYLKEGLPREYDRAIRDLSRVSDRLAQFEKRDPDRYQLELRLWQAQSRRELLTARLQMGHDESLINELRQTLRDEQELGLAVLKHERARLAARIEKIDQQIKIQADGAEASVERKLAGLTKAAKNSQRNVNSKNRKPPARKNAKDPT